MLFGAVTSLIQVLAMAIYSD